MRTAFDPRYLALLAAAVTGCAGVGSPTPTEPQRLDVKLLRALPDTGSGTIDAAAPLRAGKHLALVFWQPWCGACLAEIPHLSAAQQDHSRTLQVIGVVSGPDEVVDDDEVNRVVMTENIDYPVARDRDLRLTETLGVQVTPTIVVVDPQSRVVFRGNHSPDWNSLLARAPR